MADGGSARSRSGKAGSIFSKNVNRFQAKVLQKLGKADETKDQMFELYVHNFNNQVLSANRLQKELKRYIDCVKSMSAATRSLHEALESIYEPDWNGHESVGTMRQTSDLLWEDYQNRLVEQVFNPLLSYQSKFPEVKRRIEKRGRKMIDYDSARHAVEASKNKKDESRVAKAQEQFDLARTSYEDINNELLDELPNLYDSRIPFYASTFQLISSTEGTFHSEIGKTSLQLNSVMDKLFEEGSKGTYNVTRSNSEAGLHPISPTSPSSIGGGDNNSMFSISSTRTMDIPKPDPPQFTNDNEDDSEDHNYQAIPEDLNDDDHEYQHPPPARPANIPSSPPATQNGDLPSGVLYKVQAIHDYERKDDDELTFKKGDVIFVINYDEPDDEEDGWLMGRIENSDVKGIFPENFTSRL
ncbi:myc box-dependent-interacting protein 1-like isoform X2 [Antedon mediterranea]|uniref:myc box-dependent-interacting protein 1-like isoform X2 n=1 Tax=Antedon mediterranea TaxID=105859 RepID=UPI003AF42688